MCRLAIKQNAHEDQLREPAKRDEMLNQIEHDRIKESRPQFQTIMEGMEAMIAVVKENSGSYPPAAKQTWTLAPQSQPQIEREDPRRLAF